jgi:hypothetical protein
MVVGFEHLRDLFEESISFIQSLAPELRGVPEPCEKHETGSPLQVPGDLTIHSADQIPLGLDPNTKEKGF